jgi:hypothetical protein
MALKLSGKRNFKLLTPEQVEYLERRLLRTLEAAFEIYSDTAINVGRSRIAKRERFLRSHKKQFLNGWRTGSRGEDQS